MTGILEVDQERQAATGNLEVGLEEEVIRAEKMTGEGGNEEEMMTEEEEAVAVVEEVEEEEEVVLIVEVTQATATIQEREVVVIVAGTMVRIATTETEATQARRKSSVLAVRKGERASAHGRTSRAV